ncbi:signal peptidase I [Pelotomaculum thermopropionicum SI]|uniref:Signal peptidase I n=1 Tax=Pelotomaculum thermopropionicum (strain DSM 13744 / JCM 10971 / SI) TaxID=370438 RepID=A5D1J2_PELTS|nr:signal peptidase I [Pelotomaculum thermopropionicum SI]
MDREGLKEVHEGQKEEVKKKGRRPLFAEIFESVAIAVVLAVVIRLFVLEPFYIPSGSMEPTLKENDRIIVSKLNYRFQEPKRGDIVVFKFPRDPKRNFVKRLIAVGGETVALKDGHLYINGQAVPEDYLPPGLRFSDYGPREVPEGCYFMLGDNRNNSDDSRVWGFLPENLIVGKAVLIYWPLDRIGIVH